MPGFRKVQPIPIRVETLCPSQYQLKRLQVISDFIKQYSLRITERRITDFRNPTRYDSTGRTDENAFSDAEEMGWEAYFASLFERVDRKMLDDHKKKYQGELHSIRSTRVRGIWAAELELWPDLRPDVWHYAHSPRVIT